MAPDVARTDQGGAADVTVPLAARPLRSRVLNASVGKLKKGTLPNCIE